MRTIVMAVGALALSAAASELKVSPDGLSPAAALQAVRAAKAAGESGPWRITVAPGVYPLKAPLTFTPADSGEPRAPIEWVGTPGKTVFAGGEPICGWTDEGDGVWSAKLPAGPGGRPAFFEQLWVNGRRAERARLPNKGCWKVRNPSCTEIKGGAAPGFEERIELDEKDADLLAQVPSDELASAQMCLVCKWTFLRRILRGYDPVKHAVTTRSPTRFPFFAPWEHGSLVWFENVRSAFDVPGEWFYDAKAAKVLYRPLPGEDMSSALVLAPSAELSKLVVLSGNPEKGETVHDIVFRGISFEASASKTLLTDIVAKEAKGRYTPPAEGPTESWQYQAAQSADAAISGEGAVRVTWEDCAVRHTANYAFRLQDGCQSNSIVGCTLEDLGAGGIWIGARQGYVPPGDGDRLTRRIYTRIGPRSTAFNLVSNCTIRAAGRFNPEGTGVALTHASDCRVIHCDIHDIFYTGVSVGWTWGFQGSVAQRNEIAYNRIYDLGKGVMSDMGGVYTLGTSFGTRVHHNVIHDVRSYSYGGWALYTDEGSEGIVMEKNLCWNTTDGGFHQHYGSGCIIRNNIFAWNRMVGAVRTSRDIVQDVRCTLDFVANIVLVREGPLAGDEVWKVGGTWANNLWYDVSGRPVLMGGGWEKWCRSGREINGRYADPQFFDATGFDFRLKETSPAFDLGFKSWDYAESGRK